MASFSHKKIIALLVLLAAMLSLQGGATLAKQVIHQTGPFCATALRVGIAAIILMLAFRPKFWRFTKEQWLSVSLYGASTVAMNTIFYMAIGRIPIGIAVALEFFGPLTLALILSRKPLDLLWIVLAAGGIGLIVPFTGGGDIRISGIVFALAAGIFWALYIVFGKRTAKIMKVTDAVAVGFVVGALIILPVALATDGFSCMTPELWAEGVVIATLSSALPFTLELISIKLLPVKVFSVLLSLDPAVASLSAWVFIREILTGRQWIAISCIMAASIGSVLFAAEQETTSPKGNEK